MNEYDEFTPAIKVALSGINKDSVIPKDKQRTIVDVLKERQKNNNTLYEHR